MVNGVIINIALCNVINSAALSETMLWLVLCIYTVYSILIMPQYHEFILYHNDVIKLLGKRIKFYNDVNINAK